MTYTEEMEILPLHEYRVHKQVALFHKSHALIHFSALLALFYYRISSFLSPDENTKIPTVSFVLILFSELFLSFLWLLRVSFRWRRITRTVYPERLPPDEELPAVDVFVFTADPEKEPPLGVMNTVISAMALDYPPEKVSVYLSDDAGSDLNLYAIHEAWNFATLWIPFCRKYGIRTRCPKAYFRVPDEDGTEGSPDFLEERRNMEKEYFKFMELLRVASENSRNRGTNDSTKHPANIQVIGDKSRKSSFSGMPLLVYVSREKDPSSPHHFKAGAINVLLRVSGMISNAPYILVLDCDMYSNDPSSARQAMCFHLDNKIAPTLAFVQFPQKFHNVSKNDIYDAGLKVTFEMLWPGLDGLGGPILSGTGFYIKRKSLYVHEVNTDPILDKTSFGLSNEFLKSVSNNLNQRVAMIDEELNDRLLSETKIVASCFYEEDTEWGKKIGFLYDSVVEDFFTGFTLHCKGWKSVYYNPSRPAFLGSATTTLNDTLVQGTRWMSGLTEVTLSRFNPIVYGLPRLPLLHCMGYAYVGFIPLYCIPLLFYAFVPQLSLLKGVSLYPKVSSSWFILFSFVFSSTLAKELCDMIEIGGSIRMWWNEQTIWMMKSVTAYLYGSLNAAQKQAGFKKASFVPTNKVDDDEQVKRYEKGVFDFQASPMLLAPMLIFTILNMASFIWGIAQVISSGLWEELFGQIFISFYILVVNYPVVEGILFRKDKARIPPRLTLLSAAFVFTVVYSTAFL